MDKTLKDDMLFTIQGGSHLPIATYCFPIHTFQELKEQLPNISELSHFFTSSSFITKKVNKQECELCFSRLRSECEHEVRIPQCKSERIKNSHLDEKVRLQRLIKDLEKRRSEKRLNLYQAQDEVDEKKEALLVKVKAMLFQKIEQPNLINFNWRIL